MVFSQARNKTLTQFLAATLSLPFSWEWRSPQTAMWSHSPNHSVTTQCCILFLMLIVK